MGRARGRDIPSWQALHKCGRLTFGLGKKGALTCEKRGWARNPMRGQVAHQREIKRQLCGGESLKERENDLFGGFRRANPCYPDKVVGVFNARGDTLETIENPQVVVKKKAFEVASL
jgi:hypothetical protein